MEKYSQKNSDLLLLYYPLRLSPPTITRTALRVNLEEYHGFRTSIFQYPIVSTEFLLQSFNSQLTGHKERPRCSNVGVLTLKNLYISVIFATYDRELIYQTKLFSPFILRSCGDTINLLLNQLILSLKLYHSPHLFL